MPEKKKRRKWIDHQITATMKAVEYGKSGINKATMTHGVPKITLKVSM